MRRAIAAALALVLAAALAGAVRGSTTGFRGTNGPILYGDRDGLRKIAADGSGGALVVPAPAARPDVSADAKRIAYQRCATFASCEIWVANANGTAAHAIVTGAGTNFGPQWSPDGSRILFTSTRTGSPNLFTVKPDGTGLTQLTTDGSNLNGTWSPDGKRIAWEAGQTGRSDGCGASALGGFNPNAELWVMNADGSGKQQVTPSAAPCERSPEWSPDGTRLAYLETPSTPPFSWGAQVALVNPDGGARTVLPIPPKSVNPSALAWSPDGTTIAIAGELGPGVNGGLFALPAAGGAMSTISGLQTAGGVDWAVSPPPAKPAPKPKKPPLCKKGQKSTKKKPCRKK